MPTNDDLDKILSLRRQLDTAPPEQLSTLKDALFRAIDSARKDTSYSIDQMYEAIEKAYIAKRAADKKRERLQRSSTLQGPSSGNT